MFVRPTVRTTGRRTAVAAAATALALSVGACGSDDSRDVAELEGTWVLVELDEAEIPADPAVETRLELQDGSVAGNGGVGDLSGSYDAPEDGKVTFRVSAADGEGEENARLQQDRFLAELERVENFEYDAEDSHLELNDARDETLIVLRPAE